VWVQEHSGAETDWHRSHGGVGRCFQNLKIYCTPTYCTRKTHFSGAFKLR
jgi:hypothetical protein